MDMFFFFSQKIGSLKANEREYAFCHPLNLVINECGRLEFACVGIDREGDYYELRWLPRGRSHDDLDVSSLVVKRIGKGKYEELSKKNRQKIESYLKRDKLLTRIRSN
jgi:hypothetical protein